MWCFQTDISQQAHHTRGAGVPVQSQPAKHCAVPSDRANTPHPGVSLEPQSQAHHMRGAEVPVKSQSAKHWAVLSD